MPNKAVTALLARFNLDDLIDQVVSQMAPPDSLDADLVAAQVMQRLTAEQREMVFADLLSERVAHAWRAHMRAGLSDVSQTMADIERSVAQATKGNKSVSNRSMVWKRDHPELVARMHAALHGLLTERIPVAGQKGVKVHVRDASFEDIQGAITRRGKQIDGLRDSMEQLTRLRDIMERTNAKLVSDVPNLDDEWLK